MHSSRKPGPASFERLNEQLEHNSTAEILSWAFECFGERLAITSSFQTQSIPLLHMVAQHIPEAPVLFLDTGFHFPETLAFRDQLMEDWGLRVINLGYEQGHGEFLRRFGALYKKDPDACCRLNKVEPLAKGLAKYDAWITGIRRDQTLNRSDTPILSRRSDGLIKICPMATWTDHDVNRYISREHLPSHPLLSKGYMSIGCAPCTQPAFGDDRSGRWAGTAKTECGIHLDSRETAGRKKNR